MSLPQIDNQMPGLPLLDLLFRMNARIAQHFAHPVHFGLHDHAQLLRRTGNDVKAHFAERFFG